MNVRSFRRDGRRAARVWLAAALVAAVAVVAGASSAGAAKPPQPAAEPTAKAPPTSRPGVQMKKLRAALKAVGKKRPAGRPTAKRKPRLPAGFKKRPGAYRLAYLGQPYNYSPPWVDGIRRVGNTVNLRVGGWGDAEVYYIHLYRWSGGAWTHIGGYYLGYATYMSLYLDAAWANAYIGYYAYGYNSWYGWSDAVWSGSYYVDPPAVKPQNTSPPYADGTFEVGGTANLRVGSWNYAESYWIDLYRWTAAGGWVHVSGTYLGSATSLSQMLASEWGDSYLGFWSWAYNSGTGWGDPVWAGNYYVAPSSIEVPPPTDNIDTPGVVRNEGLWGWWLSNDFHANVGHYFQFQGCCATPVVGDWDGDGIDSPGVNIGGNRWILSNGYSGDVDHDYYYGLAGDTPIVGDWDGDGIDTPGIRRDYVFHLKNSHSGGSADVSFGYGNPGDRPLAGDFNGDGVDTVAVHRDNVFWVKNGHGGGHADLAVGYGVPSDRPLIGDWNGDGIDTPGVHRNNQFFLSNDFHGTTHYSPVYGNPGDVGVAGDWSEGPVDSWEDEAIIEGTDQPIYTLASTSETERFLVTRYAPLVFLDTGENYFPASARRWFLRRSALKFALVNARDRDIAGEGQVRANQLGGRDRNRNPYLVIRNSRIYYAWDLTRPGEEGDRRGLRLFEGFYLEFDEDYKHGVRPDRYRVPVYYHYRFERTGGSNFITYWFFYPWNDGILNHEGDWERVVVKLDTNGNATHIALYRHTCHRVRTWAQINKVPNSNTPIIFSAAGTHASYGTADKHEDTCTDVHGTGNVVTDYTSNGLTWKTWLWLANVERQPWYGFGGAWGTPGESTHTTGPLGPGLKPPAPDGW